MNTISVTGSLSLCLSLALSLSVSVSTQVLVFESWLNVNSRNDNVNVISIFTLRKEDWKKIARQLCLNTKHRWCKHRVRHPSSCTLSTLKTVPFLECNSFTQEVVMETGLWEHVDTTCSESHSIQFIFLQPDLSQEHSLVQVGRQWHSSHLGSLPSTPRQVRLLQCQYVYLSQVISVLILLP